MLSSFPAALAGGFVPEDTAALCGNPHRPQMSTDSSPLPQAMSAGGRGGAGRGLEMERWIEKGLGMGRMCMGWGKWGQRWALMMGLGWD